MTQTRREPTKREYTRFPVAVSGEVMLHGRILVAATRDVSKGGVGLLTKEPLPESGNVMLTLFLTEDGIEDPDMEPLDVEGTVVWTAEQSEGSHMAGIRFGKLSAAQDARLERFLANLGEGAQDRVA
ncbi:MAG: PilZ domain-containing protein [Polyangiales bacterium]|nr:PilZ domain-containing protein [Myxococcales bacterium]